MSNLRTKIIQEGRTKIMYEHKTVRLSDGRRTKKTIGAAKVHQGAAKIRQGVAKENQPVAALCLVSPLVNS